MLDRTGYRTHVSQQLVLVVMDTDISSCFNQLLITLMTVYVCVSVCVCVLCVVCVWLVCVCVWRNEKGRTKVGCG